MSSSFSYPRPQAERGVTRLDWLESRHSFSFGSYRDSNHMRFGALRVLNEDWVKGGHGFDAHPHENFEIITYMVSGQLGHQDNIEDNGQQHALKAGDVQIMSAGQGLTHSEMNGLHNETAHLLQIWLIPNERNTPPFYTQKHFSAAEKINRLALLLSPDAREESLPIKQNALIYASIFQDGYQLSYTPKPDRQIWLQLIRGTLHAKDTKLVAGDGFAFKGDVLELSHDTSTQEAEFLLFDLAE
jgi:redox-sensitive bicupin YhaK (pirin superfamily)